MLLVFLILAAIVLAQPSPPALGIQLGSSGSGSYVTFPLTVTQCEPVFIYYDNTIFNNFFYLYNGEYTYAFLAIGPIPVGAGYFEWFCNIPAGYGFWAEYAYLYYTVVQPGPLSSCLHNVTTTYQYASYATTSFASYTASLPSTTRRSDRLAT